MKPFIISLPPKPRGAHLITKLIESEVAKKTSEDFSGLCHLFIQHTSASLTLNENTCDDVRYDLESALNRMVPEDETYRHSDEGPDDMPAHVKTSLLGVDVCLPVLEGRFLLGRWQGIYLYEHRNQAGPRQVVITLHSSAG